MRRLLNFSAFKIFGVASFCFASACHYTPDTGFLHVDGPGGATFELYRVASETPLQVVSEQLGSYNADIPLSPGSYIVLADCSSETVTITPGSHKILVAHQVNFIPSFSPAREDRFSIQCVRSDRTKSRQHLINRFGLNILQGDREVLVGMVPVQLDFEFGEGAPSIPGAPSVTPSSVTPPPPMNRSRIVSYRLAALKVNEPPKIDGLDKGSLPYFVTPKDGLGAITESQDAGHWLFLLPGIYETELNGTRATVELHEGENLEIKPAMLRVSASEKVDFDLSSQVRGMPLYMEVNDGHWLNLNESFPVLPGSAKLKLNGSTHMLGLEFSENEIKTLETRSVLADMGCSPWEWNCLGDKGIYLFLPEQSYSFVEGVTDVPVLYLEDEVFVGLEGARDIRYKVPKNVRDFRVEVGYVEIQPKPNFSRSHITDLVRIETDTPSMVGNSLDIALDRPTRIPLIVGHYLLAHYISSTNLEGDRRRTAQGFHVSHGQVTEIPASVFLSEKRYLALKKQQEDQDLNRRADQVTRSSKNPFRPLEFF